MADPFATNPDGSAKDPAAYASALRADPERVKALQADPELSTALLGEDVTLFQDTLRKVHAASQRASELDVAMMMSSQERMRARCTVPRDVVAVYEQLNAVGLQYGPAFRLLTDVYVPADVADAQAAAAARA